MVDRISEIAVNRFICLGIFWSELHGILYQNWSSNLAYCEAQASNEQYAISKGRNIPFARSWRAEWERVRADLHDNYHSFNLTKSSCIAYVYLDKAVFERFNNPAFIEKQGIEALTPRHLAKYLLTKYIEGKGIMSFSFNEGAK